MHHFLDTNLFAPPRDELTEETFSSQYIKLVFPNLRTDSVFLFSLSRQYMLTLLMVH